MKTVLSLPVILLSFILLPSASVHPEEEPPVQLDIEPDQQRDLCSYLRDIQIGQGVTQAEWDKTCQPINAAELIRFKAQAPEKFSAYLQAAPSRKMEIQGIYEALKNKTNSPQQQETTAALLAALRAPINDMTFSAWYPQDNQVAEVYRQWLVGANEKLNKEKEDKENPVSQERHQELDSLLARNQSQLDQMKGLKDEAKFRCAIGENCAERSEISGGPGSVVAQSPAGGNLIAEEDKRPYKLPVTISGGRIDHGVPNLRVMGREVLENSPFPIPSLGQSDHKFGGGPAGIAATVALTATGAFLLLGGLGGSVLKEKYPNIRRDMGIAAGVGGVIAITALSLPSLIPAVATSPPVVQTTDQKSFSRVYQSLSQVKTAAESLGARVASLGSRSNVAVQTLSKAPNQVAEEFSTTVNGADRIRNLLMPEGQRIGQAGSNKLIRIMQGTVRDAETLFAELTQGAKVAPHPNLGPGGKLAELSDGGYVGLRYISKSNLPTIDVNVPGISIKEIKYVLP